MRLHIGKREAPKDLDLLPEPSRENAVLVIEAIEAVLGKPLPFTSADLAQPRKHICLKGLHDAPELNADLLTAAPGFDFAAHWAAAEPVEIVEAGGTVVHVASPATMRLLLEDALAMTATDVKHDPEEVRARLAKIRRDLELLTRQSVRSRERTGLRPIRRRGPGMTSELAVRAFELIVDTGTGMIVERIASLCWARPSSC